MKWLVSVCVWLSLLLLGRTAEAQVGAPPAAARQILVMTRHVPDHYRPNGAYGGGYADELSKSARRRLGRQIARQFGLTVVDDWPLPMIGLDCIVMRVPEGQGPAAVAEQVSKHSAVAWAQPVEIYQAQARAPEHGDPLFPVQPVTSQWQLARMHALATGRGVRIAVIDSGIDEKHPDLAGQLSINRNFVTGRPMKAEVHGTAVAGIVAAKAGNGLGIAGIAPDARVLGLRACSEAASVTSCDSFSLVKAVYFAVRQKADVVNLSLSGPNDRLLEILLKTAMRKGITVIAAVDKKQPSGGFPASVEGVIAVSDTRMERTNRKVYIAPGRDVPTTEPGARWSLVSGSSFAAAEVSGLVALIRQNGGEARPLLLAGRGGTIDACSSLLRVARACDCRCSPPGMARAASLH